jgi:hypothetical protein
MTRGPDPTGWPHTQQPRLPAAHRSSLTPMRKFPVSIHCTNLSVVYCGPSLPAILSMICSYLAVLQVSRRVCNRGRIRVHRCSCGISPKKNVDTSSVAVRHAGQWSAARNAVWELTAACATAPAVLLCPALLGTHTSSWVCWRYQPWLAAAAELAKPHLRL